MEVALFRPTQRHVWVDKLRRSGYRVKFVHDPERLSPSLDVVVIDSAVAKWREYILLLKDKDIPIALLTEGSIPLEQDYWTALGVAGIITPEEETDSLFSRFVKPGNVTDEAIEGTPVSFPQLGNTLRLAEEKKQMDVRSKSDATADQEEKVDSRPEDPQDDNTQERVELLPLSRRKKQRLDPGSDSIQRSSVEEVAGKTTDSANENPIADSEITVSCAVNQEKAASEPEFESGDMNSLALAYDIEGMNGSQGDPKTDGDTGDGRQVFLPLSQKRKPQFELPELEIVVANVAGFSDGMDGRKIPTGGTEEPLENPLPPSLSPLDRRGLPSVVTVYSPKGGTGKTVFLIHLANMLVKENCRVCLLDLDILHGTVAATLQLPPTKTIVDLARRIDDPKASRTCLLPMKMGFSFVAAPTQFGSFALRREQLTAILRFLKSEADVVLVDTAPVFDPVMRTLMEQSEVLLLMTTSDPASMASLKRMKPLLESLLPSPDIGIIWNRLTESLPNHRFRDVFSWPILLELPEEAAVTAAVRRGELALRSSYNRHIHSLVKQWLGAETDGPIKKRSPWARLLFPMR